MYPPSNRHSSIARQAHGKAMLPRGAQSFKYLLGCVALLARARFIFGQPDINLVNIRIKLGPLDRGSSPIPRRFRVRQHLRNTVSADAKIPSNLTPAQTFFKVSVTHLQIQIHGEYPQALPKTERAKVADFYAAHNNTTPPLPSPSIAPPFIFQRVTRCFLSQVVRQTLYPLVPPIAGGGATFA